MKTKKEKTKMKTKEKSSYLVINGKRTELTNEQLKQLGIISETCYLSDDGKIAHIGDYEFIVIKSDEKLGTTSLLMKGCLAEEMNFGENNDYRTSEIKKFLDKFAIEIANIIGEDNLVEHIVDLTADDGLKCYGTIKAKMSLFTANMIRENVDILDEFKLENWWWTCTPYSTSKHENSSWIKCVSPHGCIDDRSYYGGDGSVRPFCIVKSSIFVS
jgi:hypothetical protein